MTKAIPAATHTDIDRAHWTLRLLPASLRPYGRLARWDRPIGIWLLLFPCWWALALSVPIPAPQDGVGLTARHLPALGTLAWLMVLFAIGTVAMRGAGCTWNDILDRDFDARVERTRSRPLPAGEATVRQALVWAALQAAVGAVILLSFSWFAIAVGLASLAIVAIYPLMKRITSWPQVVLGFAFNWGALLGWAVAQDAIGWGAVALYLGGIAWTLVYDTIYAMQDQRDDAIVGVRSTARRFQAHPRTWLTIFAVLTVVGFGLAGWFTSIGPLYYVGLALVAAHLTWQVATVKPHAPADCLHKFRANRGIGWLLLAGILAGRLI
ncbi:4-hydroxybenzoate octaprenyltransferase [Vineibacter terrae]|uniref:4-hydroxybenzoate octaprenyltransferase n=1 Tax=Vineibacter terrae TaxID=2586908 RepID=A0A5C8PCL0_9HYPH|nr:4-hydroxybenzoate octaprenyltransferase [Vineibacter terrae]TXL71543.1 4-hydroxybenzoate octaprenyltransferase [Vineibacter terrae]